MVTTLKLSNTVNPLAAGLKGRLDVVAILLLPVTPTQTHEHVAFPCISLSGN